MCIIAVDILRGFLAIVAAVSIFCSTPARIQMFIFCKGGDITNDGRSILASFCFSKRRKEGQEAPFHLSYAISSPFFLFIHWSITSFSKRLLCIALLSRCWKCTIYCQAAKNDFRFTLRWYNYNTAIALIFFFRFYASIFSSIFAYQNHSSSFCFLRMWMLDVRFCVIPLGLGFRISRRRNGLAR